MRVSGLLVASATITHAAASSHILHFPGGQGINLWKLRNKDSAPGAPKLFVNGDAWVSQPDLQKSPYERKYPALHFPQPIDHFTNNSDTFQQRYWVDDRFYQPGGPVFVLDGGETSGVDRLSFLDHGILAMQVCSPGMSSFNDTGMASDLLHAAPQFI